MPPMGCKRSVSPQRHSRLITAGVILALLCNSAYMFVFEHGAMLFDASIAGIAGTGLLALAIVAGLEWLIGVPDKFPYLDDYEKEPD